MTGYKGFYLVNKVGRYKAFSLPKLYTLSVRLSLWEAFPLNYTPLSERSLTRNSLLQHWVSLIPPFAPLGMFINYVRWFSGGVRRGGGWVRISLGGREELEIISWSLIFVSGMYYFLVTNIKQLLFSFYFLFVLYDKPNDRTINLSLLNAVGVYIQKEYLQVGCTVFNQRLKKSHKYHVV